MNTGQLVRNFVAGIINQALLDYRDKPQMREEIMEFFHSNWGKELCDIVNIDNAMFIKKMEKLL